MNLTPLLEQLSIQDRDKMTIDKFRLNWAQRIYLEEVERQWNQGKPVRLIVLKARQLGMSTITEAIQFCMCFLQQGFSGLVVAHELDASEHLLGITNLYWETYPFKAFYTPKNASRKNLRWLETRSGIRITTAKNPTAGRGRTFHGVHASEVAFWLDPDTAMLSLQQTIPNSHGTFVCLESTANGIGNWFYNQWMQAEAGDSDYVPLFFPWWKHPDYELPWITDLSQLGDLEPEEKELIRLWTNGLLTGGREVRYKFVVNEVKWATKLAWRRWAIKNLASNDVKRFHQEYPSTPEEAFIATGTNVFPIRKLAACYDRQPGRPGRLIRDSNVVKFQPDLDGPLRIFKEPSKNRDHGKYLVAGDPTHTTRGDYACAQVINRRTREQVAVWRGRVDPNHFAQELAKLGRYYNDALVTTEIEGPGYATIGALMEMDYPYIARHSWADKVPGKMAETYGWSTTYKRKEWAIGLLLQLVVDEDIIIHDSETMKEMTNYISLPNGGYGPADAEGFDDTVMSMAIAQITNSIEGPLSPFGSEVAEGEDIPKRPPWEMWKPSEVEGEVNA